MANPKKILNPITDLGIRNVSISTGAKHEGFPEMQTPESEYTSPKGFVHEKSSRKLCFESKD